MQETTITVSASPQELPAGVSMLVLLERTIAALTALDADAIEALLDVCADVERPRSASEWARALRLRQVLVYLLRATGRRLEMLRQLTSAQMPFDGHYGRKPGVPPWNGCAERSMNRSIAGPPSKTAGQRY